MINKLFIFLKSYPLEGYIWVAALLALIIIETGSAHFSICPFNSIGLDFCPGCGLGRSIHHLIYFDLTESFNAHPLGGIALLILLNRILVLTRTGMRKFKTILSY